MAAKKKAAGKKSAKKKSIPMKGHNSGDATRDAEIVKIAKAQRSLDKERSDMRATWKTRQDALTARLQEIGQSRDSFKAPYKVFCEVADAKDDQEAQEALANAKVFLAQQRIAYDALGQDDQIDWVDLIQDAEEIQELRDQAQREAEEAEAAQAAEAAAGGQDATSSEAEA